jgi:hypothetical protein
MRRGEVETVHSAIRAASDRRGRDASEDARRSLARPIVEDESMRVPGADPTEDAVTA